MEFQATLNILPDVSDYLTEQERTGYAAQELHGLTVWALNQNFKAFDAFFPINADHTTMYDQFA